MVCAAATAKQLWENQAEEAGLVRLEGPSEFCKSWGKCERSRAKGWQPVLLPDVRMGPSGQKHFCCLDFWFFLSRKRTKPTRGN